MKKQMIILIWIVVIIILGSGGYVAAHFWLPNFSVEPVYGNIENFEENAINLVLYDKTLKLENDIIEKNGQLYLPVDFIKDKLDPYIFWEPEAQKLTFTTENKVIAMKTDDLNYYVNNEPMKLTLPFVQEGNMAYVPLSLILEMYNVEISQVEPYKTVIVDKKEQEKVNAQLLKKTNLRFQPSIKAAIAQKLAVEEPLLAFEEVDKFTRVRTSNGLIGYVATDSIGLLTTVPGVPEKVVETDWQLPKIDGKIIMLWDQVFDINSSANPERHEKHGNINVLSPTWFSFDAKLLETDIENIAEIVNIGDISYVDAAHDNGYQVWALITDNFKTQVSHEILSNPENRAKVIKQLLAYVSMYKLDGINIDFEAVREVDAPYYLQFLREFNPLLKEQGAILSVDMFVPVYTKYYNRTEVAKVVDYVCVMAYDEHYSGSDEPGTVASLNFVDDGILATLAEVPKEKIIMGMPFYERVWTVWEEDGVQEFEKTDMTMQKAFNQFTNAGAEFEWIAELGYWYAEYSDTEEGKDVVRKVWLEDERTIEEKLKLATAHDVAGVAGWKRFLEKDEVWQYMQKYKDGTLIQ